MPDTLPPDLLAAIDRFIADRMPGTHRADALSVIVRDWAIANGYLLLQPATIEAEDLNAANDD